MSRAASERFRDIHWEEEPTGIEDMKVLAGGRGVPVAELKAISYSTIKGGKPEVYRHEFETYQGRRPYLLRASDRARASNTCPIPRGSADLVAMGRVVDIETVDGQVILAPFYWICTTSKSGRTPVLLASRFNPEFAIEQRSGRPYIDREGIVA